MNDEPATTSDQVSAALSRLWAMHGRAEYDGPDDILGVLVQTILSQQTTRQNCRRAFGELIDTFMGDWGKIRGADQAEIERAIRTAGLAKQKSARIQALLARLYTETGEYSLEFLRDQTADEARAYLTQFKGVGPKTAAFTLMYAAGMGVFPMDTHILRICERLGWTSAADSSARAHQKMERLIPPEDHYPAHMVLVRHGREICHARNPDCEVCPLRDICIYYREHIAPRG